MPPVGFEPTLLCLKGRVPSPLEDDGRNGMLVRRRHDFGNRDRCKEPDNCTNQSKSDERMTKPELDAIQESSKTNNRVEHFITPSYKAYIRASEVIVKRFYPFSNSITANTVFSAHGLKSYSFRFFY